LEHKPPAPKPIKPRFINPVINNDFLKDWWRSKIVAANKKEQGK